MHDRRAFVEVNIRFYSVSAKFIRGYAISDCKIKSCVSNTKIQEALCSISNNILYIRRITFNGYSYIYSA